MHHHILIKILEEEKELLLLKLGALEQTIVTYKNAALFVAGHVHNKMSVQHNAAVIDESALQSLFEKYKEYNVAETTRNKVMLIIKTEQRFLHVREIARLMQLLEDETSIAAVIKKISPALSVLKKIPGSSLVSIEVSHSHFNTFWGCKDWLTETGCVRTDFMYNESELTKLQKSQVS